jgi:cytochrome c553
MKRFMLGIVLCVLLAACGEREQASTRAGGEKLSPANTAAGKAVAEQQCRACHGLDGRGTASGIPTLAAQHERYILTALREYKDGKRTHAALREIATKMSDAETRDVAAYYASLPPVPVGSAKNGKLVSPYEHGKQLATTCSKCHGDDGNATMAGTPSLAGQQPQYLFVAMQEYLNRERKAAPMHALLPGLSKIDKESLALYFASQTPRERATPGFGDAAAGEPLTAVCGGCHGAHGVSRDSATPSLAAQDPQYLVDAIKAYRTTRTREKMRLYITGLEEKQIRDIAAFYSAQKSRPAERGQTIVQELTDKCERCHGVNVADNPALAVPKINGQDRDYLIMALRAYRDDRRESSTMHRMSLPYSDSIIESLANAYASQPAK